MPSPSKPNARGPRRIRRWTPPLSCTGASPIPPQLHARTRSLSCRRDSEHSRPASNELNLNNRPSPWSQLQHVTSSRTKPPQIKVVTCAVFQRCTAPNRLSHADLLAAIRYRPSHLPMPLPQASSSKRCPTPNRQLRSNVGRRGPLRAAERHPRNDP